VPVFGIAWGTAFLGEHPTPATAAGLLIILASIALVNGVRQRQPNTRRATRTAMRQSAP
jgi:drug/metabolite transporter (DMT)-like permease